VRLAVGVRGAAVIVFAFRDTVFIVSLETMVTLAIVEAIVALPVRLALRVRGALEIVFALSDALLTVFFETSITLAVVEGIIAFPVRFAVRIRGAFVIVLAALEEAVLSESAEDQGTNNAECVHHHALISQAN